MKTFLYRAPHSKVSDLLELQYSPFIFCIHPNILQEHALLSWRESTRHDLIYSSQFSTCETTPWVLSLVLRLSSTRETMTNPGEWHQDVQMAGAPNIQGKAARWVCSAWRRDAQESACAGDLLMLSAVYWEDKTMETAPQRHTVKQLCSNGHTATFADSRELLRKSFHSGDRSVFVTGSLHP